MWDIYDTHISFNYGLKAAAFYNWWLEFPLWLTKIMQ